MRIVVNFNVTGCYNKGDQDYLIIHREDRPPHREHSRIDLPVPKSIAGYYAANLKEAESNPLKRVTLKGSLEIDVEESQNP